MYHAIPNCTEAIFHLAKSYKMCPRTFEPELDSAFAQRLSELKWHGHSLKKECRDHSEPWTIGVVLNKARFKQGLLGTLKGVGKFAPEKLTQRSCALLQVNCERLLLHTLKLANLNAISTGRAVANSITAKNPWSHAFSWGNGGQLRAQENQWVSVEDTKTLKHHFGL